MIDLQCDTEQLRGKVLFDHPLARLNTWRTGGAAQCFFEPADGEDLAFFLKRCCSQQSVMFLGLGSNTLVRDGGINGVVISLRKSFKGMEEINSTTIRVEAGVSCASLARYCAAKDIENLVFMAGIPGTVGGALRMNAGAFGCATWDHVLTTEVIDTSGNIRCRQRDDFTVAYRSVDIEDSEWFLSAEFRLQHAGTSGSAKTKVDEMLESRNQTQPVNEPNCGSVFKNPPSNYAAELIESCGLKGYAIGGAQVSEKHANFIVNKGQSSSSDIEALIKHVQETVAKETGVDLELEVMIVGEEQ